jgi:hypothetical protein
MRRITSSLMTEGGAEGAANETFADDDCAAASTGGAAIASATDSDGDDAVPVAAASPPAAAESPPSPAVAPPRPAPFESVDVDEMAALSWPSKWGASRGGASLDCSVGGTAASSSAATAAAPGPPPPFRRRSVSFSTPMTSFHMSLRVAERELQERGGGGDKERSPINAAQYHTS